MENSCIHIQEFSQKQGTRWNPGWIYYIFSMSQFISWSAYWRLNNESQHHPPKQPPIQCVHHPCLHSLSSPTPFVTQLHNHPLSQEITTAYIIPSTQASRSLFHPPTHPPTHPLNHSPARIRHHVWGSAIILFCKTKDTIFHKRYARLGTSIQDWMPEFIKVSWQ